MSIEDDSIRTEQKCTITKKKKRTTEIGKDVFLSHVQLQDGYINICFTMYTIKQQQQKSTSV